MDKMLTKFPSGAVDIPPSKSAAHRAVICAGLARGESVLRNLKPSDDVDATGACMRALRAVAPVGANFVRPHVVNNLDNLPRANTVRPYTTPENTGFSVEADSVRLNNDDRVALYCGESGTTLRLLIPVAAALTGKAAFTGRGRLMQRPLTPYFEALTGVQFTLDGDTLTLDGGLAPGVFRIRGDVSSQFVSGLLLALPLLDGDSEIILTSPLESAPYADMTLSMMARFGVTAERTARGFAIRGGQMYRAANVEIEADWSQAAFFLVAGALGCDCAVRGLSVDSVQGDRKIVEILHASGVRITRAADGALSASAERILPQTVDVSDIPDLVPPLAALFSCADGLSYLTNASRLRFKESDRLTSVTGALNALGADVAHDGETITIRGKPSLSGGVADSFGDHRIAMMCAVAAIRCVGAVTVKNAECVAKSYPDFWNDFEKEVRHG